MKSLTGVVTVAVILTLAGCSGSSGGGPSAQQPSASTHPATETRTTSVVKAKAWPAAWCQAQPGMTRQQMSALMGPPTEEFDLASGHPQMSWDFAEYQFNAFMDVDDKVRQLDVNDLGLSAAERASIHCATTRR